MREIYRCANCGHTLKKAEQRCWHCGYQRGVDTESSTEYQVILHEIGVHPEQVRDILIKMVHIRINQTNRLMKALPSVVYRGTDPERAQLIAESMNRIGAITEWGESSEVLLASAFRESQEESVDDVRPAAKPSILGKFAPFVILLLMLLPILTKNQEKILEFFRNLNDQIDGVSESEFSRVEIIAVRTEITPETLITLDHLKVIRIKRSEVPDQAVCAMDVELVLGQYPIKNLLPGDILVLNEIRRSDQ